MITNLRKISFFWKQNGLNSNEKCHPEPLLQGGIFFVEIKNKDWRSGKQLYNRTYYNLNSLFFILHFFYLYPCIFLIRVLLSASITRPAPTGMAVKIRKNPEME